MKRVLKVVLGIILGLVGLAVLAIIGLNLMGSPLETEFDVEPDVVVVPADAASIERGRHLAAAIGVCVVCHGENFGGREMVNSPVLGYIHTPNLTAGKGGIGRMYTDEDWVRALRHGVTPDGRGVIFMPTDYYYNFSDEDLGALIAYIKSVPPVDNEQSDLRLNVLTTALLNSGQFGEVVRAREIDHDGPRPDPEENYGAYLLAVSGCTFCHGPDLTGGQGPEPGAPPAPDITGQSVWGERPFEEFAYTVQTGTTPDGRVIDPAYMPWVGYGRMTEEELRAIWGYLQSLP